MFGHKKTLFENFLLAGPIVFASITGLLLILLRTFERASYSVLLVGLAGTILILIAKWPSLKERKFFTFGPKEMTASGRKYYFSGYALVILSLVGAMLLFVANQ